MTKRFVAPAVLAALLLSFAPLHAEDPPHLDFVRGLRERRYPDLALEYLQKLAKNPPADLAPLIPLEIARTRLDIASATPDLGERLTQYEAARAELDAFLQKNAAHPLAPTVRLDLARVTVLQGKTQLTRALREETRAAKQAGADKARTLLAAADKQLDEVLIQIEDKLNKYENPANDKEKQEKKALEDARVRAELDLALNYLDQRATYLDENKEEVVRLQNDLVKKAQTVLSKAAGRDKLNPLCWEAEAWVGRCQHLAGEPNKARTKFAEILNDTSKPADAGKRLARYFRMFVVLETQPQPGENPQQTVKKDANQWVKDYPAFLDTPEGYGVRWLLAQTDVELAAALPKNAPPGAKALLLTEAKTLCRQLELSENEYTVKARKLKIGIIKEEGGLSVPIASLATFDDCFVRAQYEAELIDEDAKKAKDADQLDKMRQEHLNAIAVALTKGLKLVEDKKSKAPEEEVLNARVMLAYVYLAKESYKEATKIGEELAYLKTRPPQSGKGAVYALQARGQLWADAEKAGAGPSEQKELGDQFQKLAEFMKRTWPADQPGDVARHQIGLRHIKDLNYPAAVEELAQIRPGYSGGIMSGYQLAAAALEAEKARAKPTGADQRPWVERALAALEAMPELPADADPTTNYTYLLGKIKLGQLLYPQKKFDEMEKLSEPLLQRLPMLQLPAPDLADAVRTDLVSLRLYAKYGRADAEYKAGRFGKAAEVLDPVVQEVKAGKVPEINKDAQLRWALLGMALRANIQDGKIEKAQEVLDALQQIDSGEGLVGGGSSTLLQLSALINQQVEDVRKKGTPEQLQKTLTGFNGFLDKLLEQQKGKALAPEMAVTLARCYANLDNHKKAAELLGAVEKPKDDAPQKEQEVYQYVRVMYLRELRLGGQLDAAKKELAAVKETPWGPKNIEVLKEEVFVLHEEKKWGQAAVGWDRLVKALLGKITVPGMKEQYLECYYWLVYCQYQHALTQPEPKRAATIKQAGGFIASLEVKQPDFGSEASKNRFTELLEKEPDLKAAYEQQKANPK